MTCPIGQVRSSLRSRMHDRSLKLVRQSDSCTMFDFSSSISLAPRRKSQKPSYPCILTAWDTRPTQFGQRSKFQSSVAPTSQVGKPFSIMAGVAPIDTDINGLLRRFYPSVTAISGTPSSNLSPEELASVSAAVYPDIKYTDKELVEVAQWLENAKNLASVTHSSPGLKSLNTHLATRTTTLGSKPSVADVGLFAALMPHLRAWSPEQRTGEAGWHNIVRYIDFVQNSPILGLSLSGNERILINADDVLCHPKPLDPKEEKERKKKEKAAAAATSSQSENTLTDRSVGPGKVQQMKDKTNAVVDVVKSKGTEAAAAVGLQSQKKEKKQKQPKQPAAPPAPEKPIGPNLIDLRVGHILKCERHPNADSLYVSTMDVGDPEGTKDTWVHEESGRIVRTVCSGLNGLIPLDTMQGRRVVAVCNLKPVKMRGITSCAMVLAASPRLQEGAEDNHTGPVELVEVPEGPLAGTRVAFEGFEGDPEVQLNPKKKIWESIQIGFTTLAEDGTVAFERGRTEVLSGEKGEGKPVVSKLHVKGGGVCRVPTLKDAVVR